MHKISKHKHDLETESQLPATTSAEEVNQLKAERDDLRKRLELAQAVSSHLRASYVSRITAQTANSLDLSQAVEKVLASLREISTSYHEMLNSVQNVDRISQEFHKSFAMQAERQGTMMAQVSSVNAFASEELGQSQELKASINRVQGLQNFIAEAIEHIDEISAKLSMLSINGRIEAARVGSLGAGFGIVAKEMRKLQEENQTVISGQKAQVKEFLPVMQIMKEKSDAVATAASQQKLAVQRVFEESQTHQNLLTSNLAQVGGLTSAIGELASAIEQGEKTMQTIDHDIAKVERIFKEEVFVAKKVDTIDSFIFEASEQSPCLTEAANKVLNKYQAVSIINGSPYVWQAESWLLVDQAKLPPSWQSSVPATRERRVAVLVGQSTDNPSFSNPPREGIYQIRALEELKNPSSPLFGLKLFLEGMGLSYEQAAQPQTVVDKFAHSGMRVLESFISPLNQSFSEKIRQGRLVCPFYFGGMFPNGDILINQFLSNYQRTEQDAQKFGMIGEIFVLGLMSHVENDHYWAS